MYMNLAILTHWKRIFSNSIPSVPIPCRAWKNWEYSKDKLCDCECICKIPYKSNEIIKKITKNGKDYLIIKHMK